MRWWFRMVLAYAKNAIYRCISSKTYYYDFSSLVIFYKMDMLSMIIIQNDLETIISHLFLSKWFTHSSSLIWIKYLRLNFDIYFPKNCYTVKWVENVCCFLIFASNCIDNPKKNKWSYKIFWKSSYVLFYGHSA